RWLPDGKSFLWSTERRGAWQLELHTRDGKLVRELSPPDLGFREVVRVAPDGSVVTFKASRSPLEEIYYDVPVAGGPPTPRFTDAEKVQNAPFDSETGAYVRVRNLERTSEVHRPDGSLAGTLTSVAEAPPKLEAHAEFSQAGPQNAWTAVVRPRTFDPK